MTTFRRVTSSSGSIYRLVAVLSLLLFGLASWAPASAEQASCHFVLGFKLLHDLDQVDTGDCVDNQAFSGNGDATQHTTHGLMVWQKAGNWTGFTNGYGTLVIGQSGLEARLNTQRFAWEPNPAHLSVVPDGMNARVGFISPTVQPSSAGSGNQPGTSPILWGVYSGAVDRSGTPIETAISQYQSELSHPVQVFHIFVDWTASWSDVAQWGAGYAISTGRIPLITYEAWNRPLDQIAAGAFDRDIDGMAVGAAATKSEVWIRIFHEFNDCTNYPWQSCHWTAPQFVSAWRHIVDRFRADGATNVKFIWEPDGTGSIDAIGPYYPGDNYVDYTGWDDYGYNTARDYAAVSAVSPKPMVLGEVGASDNKLDWLESLASNINNGNYRLIHSVIWFDNGSVALAENRQIRMALRTMLAGRFS